MADSTSTQAAIFASITATLESLSSEQRYVAPVQLEALARAYRHAAGGPQPVSSASAKA